jgi:hypothetical protein
MAGEAFDIMYYHQEGTKALEEKNYKHAANMFFICHQKYQNAEDHVLSFGLADLGEDAAEKYTMIITTYLKDDGFDHIIYEQ